MFSLINRGEYSQSIEDEFENLFARLRSLLGQTFDIDGNLIVADPSLAVVPVGGIVAYGGSEAPTGYLLCNGTPVSRVEYRSLFNVIGTTYGAGDGSTTFNLPNLTGRFPLGKAGSGTGSALGSAGGAIDHTHSGASHTHSISTQSDHSHSVNSHNHSISSGGSHTHSFSATTSEVSGLATPTGLEEAATRTGTHTHSVSGTTGSDGSHDHGGNTGNASPGTSSAGSHNHGGSTGSGGTGNTGTANPPFLAVNYIIFAGA